MPGTRASRRSPPPISPYTTIALATVMATKPATITGTAASRLPGLITSAHQQERQRGQQEGDELPDDVQGLGVRSLSGEARPGVLPITSPTTTVAMIPDSCEAVRDAGTCRRPRRPRSTTSSRWSSGQPHQPVRRRHPPRAPMMALATTVRHERDRRPRPRRDRASVEGRQGDREQHDARPVVEQALGLDRRREPRRRAQPPEQRDHGDRVRRRDHRPEQERERQVQAGRPASHDRDHPAVIRHAREPRGRATMPNVRAVARGRSCRRPRTRAPAAGPRGSAPAVIARLRVRDRRPRGRGRPAPARRSRGAHPSARSAPPPSRRPRRSTNSSPGSRPSTVRFAHRAASVADRTGAGTATLCDTHRRHGWIWDCRAGGRSSAAAARGSAAASRRSLAGEGARVALIGRTRERIEAEAARLGGVAVVADLVDARRAGRRGGSERSPPSAGWTCSSSTRVARPAAPSTRLSEADWETAIAGTLQSTLRLLRAALPHLREGVRPVDPDRPVVVRPRADPGPHHVQRPATGPRRPRQVADRRDRPDPDQRPGARADRHGPDRLARRQAGRGRRASPARRSNAAA